MVTMIDENFDRNYQAGRVQLNAGLAEALTGISQSIGKSLSVLHRIAWSAPWRPQGKPSRRA
jgi:hypothetical protein